MGYYDSKKNSVFIVITRTRYLVIGVLFYCHSPHVGMLYLGSQGSGEGEVLCQRVFLAVFVLNFLLLRVSDAARGALQAAVASTLAFVLQQIPVALQTWRSNGNVGRRDHSTQQRCSR